MCWPKSKSQRERERRPITRSPVSAHARLSFLSQIYTRGIFQRRKFFFASDISFFRQGIRDTASWLGICMFPSVFPSEILTRIYFGYVYIYISAESDNVNRRKIMAWQRERERDTARLNFLAAIFVAFRFLIL